ncbi:hypothetical protein [Ignavibacterium sp.]|uniref:hypothetical protein n=1 Tax=Ignavibacterium sp. TaxID=2651167 RepID=UPI00307FA522
MKLFFFFCINLIIILSACSGNNNELNKNLADVFKPLDGTWQGEFKVFVDENGQHSGVAQPEEIDFDILNQPSLKLQSVIKATHIYNSVDSFRQEGEIIDILTKDEEKVDTIKSKLVNEVKNGKLKCFVYKPNETVIHEGKYLGNNTIVWQRSLSNPLKIEYFKETVSGGHYKIIGWGYHGNDNPALTPRYWFYADYVKVE